MFNEYQLCTHENLESLSLTYLSPHAGEFVTVFVPSVKFEHKAISTSAQIPLVQSFLATLFDHLHYDLSVIWIAPTGSFSNGIPICSIILPCCTLEIRDKHSMYIPSKQGYFPFAYECSGPRLFRIECMRREKEKSLGIYQYHAPILEWTFLWLSWSITNSLVRDSSFNTP